MDDLLVPRQNIDRYIATCGSHEFGQTGFASLTSIPRLCTKDPLEGAICGGWQTKLIKSNKQTATIGIRAPSRAITFKEANLPIRKCCVSDSFEVYIATSDRTIRLSGDFDIVKPHIAVDIFAKFDILCGLTPKEGSADKLEIFVCRGKDMRTLSFPENETVHHIEPNERCVCVLSKKGTLRVYYENHVDPDHVLEKVVSVASTRTRTILLQADGRVMELIRGRTIPISGIEDLPVKVFAGGAHFGCITHTGRCFTWGCGSHGQLGTGKIAGNATPAEIIYPENMKVVDGSAGENHTALTVVHSQKFCSILPNIMRSERIPATLLGNQVMPYAYTPPEFDTKF